MEIDLSDMFKPGMFMQSNNMRPFKDKETMYFLWMKQTGYGCDYTVGCGEKMVPLKADNLESAKIEAKEILIEMTHSEQKFEKAKIVHLMSDVSYLCQEAEKTKNQMYDNQEREKRRSEYERLKKEFN